MLYGTFFVVSGVSWAVRRANNTATNSVSSLITATLQVLGNHSYTLFFAHTVALRVWFGWKYEVVPVQTLLLVSGALVVTYVVSRWVEK
jgi:peptidoglycan/LPS O-acetylase OafA/YrhL